jgi:hypothetical protein
LNFTDLANPRWFARDAAFAWGFYGHRLHLYRNTVPHAGYALLQQLCEVVGQHAVYTSNVDGAFEKAGFAPDPIVAIHGSIHRLQCTQADHGVWSADGVTVDVDPDTFRARGTLPTCPTCGAVARPNILMFGDGGFVSGPTDDAEHRFFTHLNGKLAATPLFVALLVIETTDVAFAVDSVPAVLAISQEPFVAFGSNICAILGLRAMFFVVAEAMQKFHLLKYGLGLVLVWVGMKMTVLPYFFKDELTNPQGHVPIPLSLGVIIALIGGTMILSLVIPARASAEESSATESDNGGNTNA